MFGTGCWFECRRWKCGDVGSLQTFVVQTFQYRCIEKPSFPTVSLICNSQHPVVSSFMSFFPSLCWSIIQNNTFSLEGRHLMISSKKNFSLVLFFSAFSWLKGISKDRKKGCFERNWTFCFFPRSIPLVEKEKQQLCVRYHSLAHLVDMEYNRWKNVEMRVSWRHWIEDFLP